MNRRVIRTIALIGCLASIARADDRFAPVIQCVNVDLAQSGALRELAKAEGRSLQSDASTDPIGSPSLVLWEAKASNEIDDAHIAALTEYLRSTIARHAASDRGPRGESNGS